MLGSNTLGCRCAQISRREQSIKGKKYEGRVGMGQWAFQMSRQPSAAVVVKLRKWGVTWPQTTQPWRNGLLKKVSVSCLLQANPPTQNGNQGTVCRACVPLLHHHSSLFPHSHRSLSSVGLIPSRCYWPNFHISRLHTARHQGTFWELRQSHLRVLWKWHHGALLGLCSSKADLLLLCTKSFWSLRVTSQLWRSVCTDPALVYVYLTL